MPLIGLDAADEEDHVVVERNADRRARLLAGQGAEQVEVDAGGDDLDA